MSLDLLLANGEIVFPDEGVRTGSIGVRDGRIVAVLATTERPVTPGPVPAPLTPQQAEERAKVNGKYRNLLRVIPADADSDHYGVFHDYGRWDGTSYLGHDNLPRGYWVYVTPNWYLWGDADEAADGRK